MKTYRFAAELHDGADVNREYLYVKIAVEADNYDDAFALANEEADTLATETGFNLHGPISLTTITLTNT